MKNLLIFFFTWMLESLYAQIEIKEWAPIGANWLYWAPNFSNEYFVIRVAHDKDTILFKHKYKKFDIYNLQVRPNFSSRIEQYVYSYYIGISGDTVFCPSFNNEIYYINKKIVGEKIFPFYVCDSTDSLWVKLDTIFYKKWGNIIYPNEVYSGNSNAGKLGYKDTFKIIVPFNLFINYNTTVQLSLLNIC